MAAEPSSEGNPVLIAVGNSDTAIPGLGEPVPVVEPQA
jgi:hypothetical protein